MPLRLSVPPRPMDATMTGPATVLDRGTHCASVRTACEQPMIVARTSEVERWFMCWILHRIYARGRFVRTMHTGDLPRIVVEHPQPYRSRQDGDIDVGTGKWPAIG